MLQEKYCQNQLSSTIKRKKSYEFQPNITISIIIHFPKGYKSCYDSQQKS